MSASVLEPSTADASATRWSPGDVVALRYITRDGRPGMSWPFRVVEDRADRVALYIPRGAQFKAWQQSPEGERRLADSTWRNDVLRLMFPGRQHSVWLFWHEDEAGERRFSSYYVNMEEPFRRTSIGFDTNDHVLDIVVGADFAWHWKDEELLAERVRQGVYPAEFADSVRAEGERVLEALAGRQSPFGDGWETWQPDPAWTVPELPPTWQEVPASLWDRRHWAYGTVTP